MHVNRYVCLPGLHFAARKQSFKLSWSSGVCSLLTDCGGLTDENSINGHRSLCNYDVVYLCSSLLAKVYMYYHP